MYSRACVVMCNVWSHHVTCHGHKRSSCSLQLHSFPLPLFLHLSEKNVSASVEKTRRGKKEYLSDVFVPIIHFEELFKRFRYFVVCVLHIGYLVQTTATKNNMAALQTQCCWLQFLPMRKSEDNWSVTGVCNLWPQLADPWSII